MRCGRNKANKSIPRHNPPPPTTPQIIGGPLWVVLADKLEHGVFNGDDEGGVQEDVELHQRHDP